MSDELVTGADLAAVHLAATVTFADAPSGASRIYLYTELPASALEEPAVVPQVEVMLAKPCGTVAAGGLTLHVATPAGSMVMASGVPLWGRWVRSDGKLLAAGRVVDMDPAHLGAFRVEGATTVPGDESPTLQAGGLVQLGVLTFG